jgi:hypothetical protein
LIHLGEYAERPISGDYDLRSPLLFIYMYSGE